MANQKFKNGSFRILSDEECRNNPNGWCDIDEDILVISKNSPGIVAVHPVADSPVIVITDKVNEISAVCHCSAELIDIKMPALTVDALKKAEKIFKNNVIDSNLEAYVSACAGPNWTYDTYPKWAKDEQVWKNSIIPFGDKYRINLRQAILEQLKDCGFKLINFSTGDTIEDSIYYSNALAKMDKSKIGRQLMGAFYEDEIFVKKLRK